MKSMENFLKMYLTIGLTHAMIKPRKRQADTKQGFMKGSEGMDEGMTNLELAVLLETLAKLVEATATDAADAARIIREAIPQK